MDYAINLFPCFAETKLELVKKEIECLNFYFQSNKCALAKL
jgi:hypothetical protein